MPQDPEIFRLRDADDAGLTRGRLRGMLRRGDVERIGRGLYRRTGDVTELDTIATVCARVPDAIVCLLSALAIHDIGTQLPDQVWIALDRKMRKPRLDEFPVRIVRFSGPMLRYGIETRVVQSVRIKVTSPARTIVDCFRYRNKIGLDVALEALKDGVLRRRASVSEITRAAQMCRIATVIKPFLEATVA